MALTKTRLLKHDFPVHGPGELLSFRFRNGKANNSPDFLSCLLSHTHN